MDDEIYCEVSAKCVSHILGAGCLMRYYELMVENCEERKKILAEEADNAQKES